MLINICVHRASQAPGPGASENGNYENAGTRPRNMDYSDWHKLASGAGEVTEGETETRVRSKQPWTASKNCLPLERTRRPALETHELRVPPPCLSFLLCARDGNSFSSMCEGTHQAFMRIKCFACKTSFPWLPTERPRAAPPRPRVPQFPFSGTRGGGRAPQAQSQGTLVKITSKGPN